MTEATTIDPQFLKCPCNHCGNHIEFELSQLYQAIACPHCGSETRLFTRAPKAKKPLFTPARVNTILRVSGYVAAGAALALLISYITQRVMRDPLAAAEVVGGVAYVALFVFAVILAVFWIVFPLMVYFKLKRLVLETVAIRANSQLIEAHNRKLVELGVVGFVRATELKALDL